VVEAIVVRTVVATVHMVFDPEKSPEKCFGRRDL